VRKEVGKKFFETQKKRRKKKKHNLGQTPKGKQEPVERQRKKNLESEGEGEYVTNRTIRLTNQSRHRGAIEGAGGLKESNPHLT